MQRDSELLIKLLLYMNSVFSFAVGLLTAALSLLGFVQQHPELPQSSKDQAQQIAQQAITKATNALNTAPKNIPIDTPVSSATIDKNSLSTNSSSPTITGTCTNISGALAISIVSGNVFLPTTALPSSAVYSEATDHGGQFDANCSASNGTFSTHGDNPKLQAGTYNVGIYTYTNVYTNTGYQGPSSIRLLTSGTLTITSNIPNY